MASPGESHPYRTVECCICASPATRCDACDKQVCGEHTGPDGHDCAGARKPVPTEVLARAVAAWGYVSTEEAARERQKSNDRRWGGIWTAVLIVFMFSGCVSGGYGLYKLVSAPPSSAAE